jgi:hypothetical protein
VQANFFKLYMLAGILEADGVIPLKPDEIAWRLRISLEELNDTLALLEDVKLYKNNGRGPELPFYTTEQITREQLERKRASGRERQEKYREKHNSVTTEHVTPLQPRESESEVESEVESDKRTDDLVLTTLKIIAIPAKFRQRILENTKITQATVLAAYASALAQSNKGEPIKHPAGLAGWKLASCELPEQQWENPERWQQYIPTAQLQKLGLSIQGEEEEEQPVCNNGYTQFNPKQNKSVTRRLVTAWESVIVEFSRELPKGTIDKYFLETIPIRYKDKRLTIGVPTKSAEDWLSQRAGKQAERYLVGILNQDIKIEFVEVKDGSKGN